MTSAALFLIGVSCFAVVALAFCGAYLWHWFRRWSFALASYAALVAALLPGAALAQDPAAALTAGIMPDVQQISDALAAGKYALGVMLILATALRFFRGPVLNRLPQENGFVKWCKGTLGGWVLNFIGAELASLSGYFLVSPTVTPAGVISAVLGGVALAFTGAGAHEFSKDVGLGPKVPVAPPPAPVLTPVQAADTLNLPPKE